MSSLVKNKLNDQRISISFIRDVLKNQGIITFLKKSNSYSKRTIYLLLPISLKIFLARKIKGFESNNVKAVVNYSFNVLAGLIRPVQIPEEFEQFLTLLQKQKPKNVLEIGTDKGGSLFAMCKVAPHDTTVISLDLPEGVGDGYPKWKEAIFHMFKKPEQKLLLLRGDSHSDTTLNQVRELLRGEKFDFAFLDGDHTYEGVKKDFEMYSTLVRAGGIIAFHDIAINEAATGVPQFWQEVKNNYDHVEFIQDEKQIGYGIGCLFV